MVNLFKIKSTNIQLMIYFFIFYLFSIFIQTGIKYFYTYPNLLRAKNKFIENNINILKRTIENEIFELNDLLFLYSDWERLIYVVNSNDDDLTNFTEEFTNYFNLKSLNLDLVSLYNREEVNIWYSILKENKLNTGKNDHLIPLMDYFKLFNEDTKLTNKNTFYFLDDNFYIISIAPLKNSKNFNIEGYLLLGRRLEKKFSSYFNNKDNIKINIISEDLDVYNEKPNLIKLFNFTEYNTNNDYDKYYISLEKKLKNTPFILELDFNYEIKEKELFVLNEIILNAILVFILLSLLYKKINKKIVLPIKTLKNHIKKIKLEGIYTECKIETYNIESKNLMKTFNNLINITNQKSIELQFKNKNLEKLSYLDSLTGLYNRRKLEVIFENLIAREKDGIFHLIICDVDYFKNYNDFYGHLMGDKILKKISETLKDVLSENELVFRYGGEEFIVLLSNLNKEQIIEKVMNIKDKIESLDLEHKKSKIDNKITLSYGLVSFSYKDRELYEIIKKADIALYKAKENGRNRLEIYKEF